MALKLKLQRRTKGSKKVNEVSTKKRIKEFLVVRDMQDNSKPVCRVPLLSSVSLCSLYGTIHYTDIPFLQHNLKTFKTWTQIPIIISSVS